MNSANERLDKLVIWNRNKSRFLVLLVVFITLASLTYFFLYTPDKKITEVKGVVINIQNENWSGPFDEHFYIIIKLESGETARYEIPRESIVKIGDTVLVSPFTFRRINE